MNKLIVLIATLFAVTSIPQAQIANEGIVLGVVADQSGAVIPGAKVTAKNLDTGFTKEVLTNASGDFEILSLPIGQYSVTVSMNGFKGWKLEKMVLEIGQRSRLSPVLQLGSVSEQVTVAGLAQQIQTESAAAETVIQQKQVVDLPLDGRNVIQLVGLAPGMQYTGQAGGQFGAERGSTVQGSGVASGQTQFQLDGSNANGSMDEGAIAIPSVDTIAEFNVQTSNFSAENGRFPLQVLVATKAGANQYHGSAWEFARNSAFSAKNYFTPPNSSNPRLIQNQFGVAGGGRIIRDKTFFFGSWELLRVRQEQFFDNRVPTPAMLTGDFSGRNAIYDPTTSQQFSYNGQSNVIPPDRIDSAAKFFFPYWLASSTGRYQAIAPVIDDTSSGTARIDDELRTNQHLYGRWVRYGSPTTFYNDTPAESELNNTIQQSYTLNYAYTISPTILFSINGGFQESHNSFVSPGVGVTNLDTAAGIAGFTNPAQQAFAGIPGVSATGLTGFGLPWGVNGRLWSHSWNGTTSLNLVRGKHLIDFGLQGDVRAVYGNHASFASRGNFGFNGQYTALGVGTGDGFADYLLGLVSSASRNFPLAPFGVQRAPYGAAFVEDTYKVTRHLTLNLGLRYDYWYEKQLLYGNGATFDPQIGKVVAGVDASGDVNLVAQAAAPYFAAATAGEWIPANQVGVPAGLFKANGYFSPRVGISWNPFKDTVIRGAYGIFTSSFQGNISASSIVGPPYWSYETPNFSYGTMQKWETAFPAGLNDFGPSSVASPAWDVRSQKLHEWNMSVQQSLPFHSALTLSYVGNRLFDGISGDQDYDAVPAGNYPNLQAALPYPDLTNITLFQNLGQSWYNGLQAKWERRMTDGLTFTGSYAFSKLMLNNMAAGGPYNSVQPLTPAGYTRGRSPSDVRNLLTVNSVYELPTGRGRKYLSTINQAADLILGGWEISGIFSFASGTPLSFDVPGATLGNGYDTRPNLISGVSLQVPHPNATLWFNPGALAAPLPYTYGSSGMGIFEAPANYNLDTALLKNFRFREGTYLQFRFEAFNMPNFVNLGSPDTTINDGTTGEIFSAGAPRELQFGLKLIF
jgi:hypothetical protein